VKKEKMIHLDHIITDAKYRQQPSPDDLSKAEAILELMKPAVKQLRIGKSVHPLSVLGENVRIFI